jgi:hypothetical protein
MCKTLRASTSRERETIAIDVASLPFDVEHKGDAEILKLPELTSVAHSRPQTSPFSPVSPSLPTTTSRVLMDTSAQ